MPRYRSRYGQPDPASQAQRQAVSQAVQQRQAQTSAYAAARFNEWAAGSQDREALMNARLQQAQASAEMAGAQFRYNLWKDNELRAQTTHYYNAMPAFQQALKDADIKPGSERYRAEMASFASTIPDALTHNEAIRKELSDFAKVDASQEQITNRLNTVIGALNQAGQRPTSFSTTAQGGVDVKATRPMDDLQKEYGITPRQFSNMTDIRRGTVGSDGKLTGQDYGPTVEFPAGTDRKTGNPIMGRMSINDFNYYAKQVGRNPLPVNAPKQGTPIPTPSQAPIPSATPEATPAQTPIPSPTPTADQQQPAIRRYNPDTGELE